MRRCWVVLSFVLVLATGSRAWSQGNEKKSVDPKRIAELVQQLGSMKFLERENARRELEAIGTPAMEALKKAAKSQDLETNRRAGEILRLLEERNNTAQILVAKRVRLNLKDVTVLAAVKELEKQSQYPILIQGDQTALAKRKVTLDTGDTTFWEALDQLCAKAGLVETTGQNFPQPFPQPFPAPMPPIKDRPAPGILPVIPPAAPDKKGPIFRLEAKAAAQAQAIAVAQDVPAQPPAPMPPVQGKPVQLPGVQVKPIQIKGIQVLPVQVQPIQIQPFPMVRPMPGNINQNQIILTPGEPKKVPTFYAGAVRVRLFPGNGNQAGQAGFLVDISAEPRLQDLSLIGIPRIDKAIDDQGQSLMMAMEPMPQQQANANFAARRIAMPTNANQRQALIRLKLGEKAAKSLKELKGSFTASALLPTEPLITMDNVLKSAGKTVKGANGSAINLKAITKMDNGDYQVQITMENMPGGNNPLGGMGVAMQINIRVGGGGNVVINGFQPVNNRSLPTLVDAKGRSYQRVDVPEHELQVNNGVARQNVTLVFRPSAGQGEPARLVLNGQRTVNFQVPFTFTNVPLP